MFVQSSIGNKISTLFPTETPFLKSHVTLMMKQAIKNILRKIKKMGDVFEILKKLAAKSEKGVGVWQKWIWDFEDRVDSRGQQSGEGASGSPYCTDEAD